MGTVRRQGWGPRPDLQSHLERIWVQGLWVPSPCLHPLLLHLGVQQDQEAPQDPAPHHGQWDQCGPSHPVESKEKSHDLKTTLTLKHPHRKPSVTQELTDPSRAPTLTGTPFSPAAPGGP